MKKQWKIQEKLMKKSMKNRWKFDEKSSKIELGGVLGPPGASWGAFLASLGVLGASWERLESVLERLGGVPESSRTPKGTPHGPQDGPKIVQKSMLRCIVFWASFFDRFLVGVCFQLGPIGSQKSWFFLRKIRFFEKSPFEVSIDFWSHFGLR